MKNLIVFLAAITLLLSCKSYQMSTVSSLHTKKNDSTGVFNVENDSLIISYDFVGDNMPLNVEVFNKLNTPLYINWERSALIVEDKAYSYVDDQVYITGQTSGNSYNWANRRNSFYENSGTINEVAKLSKNESFIPPHSKVTRSLYVLDRLALDNIQPADFKRVSLALADGNGSIRSKEATFSAKNSPLKFKSYLTFYTLVNNQPQIFSSQQDFFVSSVTKSGINPKNLIEYYNSPGNIIINSKTTAYGKTMEGVAVVGAIGAIGAIDASQNNRHHR